MSDGRRTLPAFVACATLATCDPALAAPAGPVTSTAKPPVVDAATPCAARRVHFQADVTVEDPEPGFTTPTSVVVRWLLRPAGGGAAIAGPARTLPLATGAVALVRRDELLPAGLAGTETLVVTFRGREYPSAPIAFALAACGA